MGRQYVRSDGTVVNTSADRQYIDSSGAAFNETNDAPAGISATAGWTEGGETLLMTGGSARATAAWTEGSETVAVVAEQAVASVAAAAAWTEGNETVALTGGGVAVASSWTEGNETTAAVVAVSAPGVGTFSTPPMKNNEGILLANQTSVTVNIYHISTGELVVQKINQTSNAAGVVTVTDALLISGTNYAYEVVLLSLGRRLPVAVAS